MSSQCPACKVYNAVGVDQCDFCGSALANNAVPVDPFGPLTPETSTLPAKPEPPLRSADGELVWIECDRAQPCEVKWSTLLAMGDPQLRKCPRCAETVVAARSEDAVEYHRSAGENIAVPNRLHIEPRKRATRAERLCHHCGTLNAVLTELCEHCTSPMKPRRTKSIPNPLEDPPPRKR